MCGLDRCKKGFRNEVQLRVHLLRSHNLRIARPDAVPPHRIACADLRGKYICTNSLCGTEWDTPARLIKHLKNHMLKGEITQCPYRNCKKCYRNISSFTSHLTKNHKSDEHLQIHESNNIVPPVNEAYDAVDPGIHENSTVSDDGAPDRTINCSDFSLQSAQFFLKLETQYRIPASTVQFIVSELSVIQQPN